MAAENGSFDIAELFLSSGADVNTKDNVSTALVLRFDTSLPSLRYNHQRYAIN